MATTVHTKQITLKGMLKSGTGVNMRRGSAKIFIESVWARTGDVVSKWAASWSFPTSGIVKTAPGTKMPLLASGGKSVILKNWISFVKVVYRIRLKSWKRKKEENPTDFKNAASYSTSILHTELGGRLICNSTSNGRFPSRASVKAL